MEWGSVVHLADSPEHLQVIQDVNILGLSNNRHDPGANSLKNIKNQ